MSDIDDVNADNVDEKIAYHEEMEYICYRAHRLGMAAHHRNMQQILRELKKHIKENWP
jgi:hypothetical protein